MKYRRLFNIFIDFIIFGFLAFFVLVRQFIYFLFIFFQSKTINNYINTPSYWSSKLHKIPLLFKEFSDTELSQTQLCMYSPLPFHTSSSFFASPSCPPIFIFFAKPCYHRFVKFSPSRSTLDHACQTHPWIATSQCIAWINQEFCCFFRYDVYLQLSWLYTYILLFCITRQNIINTPSVYILTLTHTHIWA